MMILMFPLNIFEVIKYLHSTPPDIYIIGKNVTLNLLHLLIIINIIVC